MRFLRGCRTPYANPVRTRTESPCFPSNLVIVGSQKSSPFPFLPQTHDGHRSLYICARLFCINTALTDVIEPQIRFSINMPPSQTFFSFFITPNGLYHLLFSETINSCNINDGMAVFSTEVFAIIRVISEQTVTKPT